MNNNKSAFAGFTVSTLTVVTGFTVGTALTWLLRRRVERILILWRNRFDHPTNETMKMVIVARTDIDMKSGKLAAQCAHAAVSNYVATARKYPEVAELWLAQGQAKVVVRCNDENSLNFLKHKASGEKMVCTLIKDAGRTQLIPGTVTVLGIGPAKKDIIDKITGQLRLY